MKVTFPRMTIGRRFRAATVFAGVLALGATFTALVVPSAAVTGGTCPVAYSQSIFVSIPLPAGSNGRISGQIGIDCNGYTQNQVIGPSHGTISWSGPLNEDYSYAPAAGYAGPDSVEYCQVLVSNPQAGCQGDSGELTFFIGHANNDTYVTSPGTPLLVGCSGCPGDPLTNDQPPNLQLANLNSLPSHGTLTWQKGNWSPASFEYVPDPGFKGTDSFTYCMRLAGVTGCPPTFLGTSNGVSGIVDMASSNIATVTIKVGPLPKPTVKLLSPAAPFTLAGKVTVSWKGADYSGGPGLAYYLVRTRRAPWNGGFGSWTASAFLPSVTTSTHAALAAGYDYCFEVRTADLAGLTSPWSAPRCTARPLDDTSLKASRGWTRKTSGQYYLGTYTTSKRKGAWLTRAGARAERVAIVATRCPGCGSFAVYAGSKLLGKINLAHKSAARKTVFVLPSFSLRSVTVTIKVLSSGKTVQIDGLGIARM